MPSFSLGFSSAYIARWQVRFARQRLAGLFARHPADMNQQLFELGIQ